LLGTAPGDATAGAAATAGAGAAEELIAAKFEQRLMILDN
jgi:hypothetical protein